MSDYSAKTMRYYRVFGLTLRSAFDLPELETASEAADAIEIVAGPVPILAAEGRSHWLAPDRTGAILTVPGVARFRIRDGAQIVVDAESGAALRNVRLFLLGSAMGALLHQRRMLPLHANAIAVGGRAIAFLGHSGAGKSTLAAAFEAEGRAILSDDVCVVDEIAGAFIAQPGIPRLRLWRDAVERSGRDVGDYERAFDTLDKYTVATGPTSRTPALPLAAIFLLARHDGDNAADVTPLSGVDAFQALVQNTYRGSFVEMVGDPRWHFQTCLQLSRSTPMFRFSRPWDVDRIAPDLAQLDRRLETLGLMQPTG